MAFGDGGAVQEYDSEGAVVWRIEGNAGYVFRAQRIQSLYHLRSAWCADRSPNSPPTSIAESHFPLCPEQLVGSAAIRVLTVGIATKEISRHDPLAAVADGSESPVRYPLPSPPRSTHAEVPSSPVSPISSTFTTTHTEHLKEGANRRLRRCQATGV